MSDIQHLPDPVHWFEGMLLSPQHFQQNNYYLEQLMFYHLKMTQPYYWGVKRLEVDENAINHDMLVVTTVEAIMSDGTVVREGIQEMHYPEQLKGNADNKTPANKLSLELDKIIDVEPQQPFFVYLCVPNMTDACASDEETDLKRYDSVNVGNVVDHNNMQNRVDLMRLRPRIQLVAEPQFSKVKYSGFPLFKLEKTYDGSFKRLNYTPPFLSVTQGARSVSVELTDKIEKQMGEIRSKATGIRNFFTDNNSHTNMVSSLQKQRIYHLTAQLPALEVLFYSQNAHPFQLYQTIVQLAGHMSILQASLLPPLFKDYNHDDVDGTFKMVLDFIGSICDSIRLDFSSIPFEQDENARFSADVETLPKDEVLHVTCKLTSGSSLDKLKQWIQTASIASENNWDDLILARASGATRHHKTEFKQLNLVEGEDEVFFEIRTDSGHIEPFQKLYISGSDETLKEHKPASINWFIPRETGK